MKKTNLAVCLVLALLLLVPAGPAVHATEDTQKKERSEEYAPPADSKPRKKKFTRTPDRFEPTDKVSADQAVAFPTDI